MHVVPILFGSIVAQADLIGKKAEDEGKECSSRDERRRAVVEDGQIRAA
jgi:hypothetical protein